MYSTLAVGYIVYMHNSDKVSTPVPSAAFVHYLIVVMYFIAVFTEVSDIGIGGAIAPPLFNCLSKKIVSLLL